MMSQAEARTQFVVVSLVAGLAGACSAGNAAFDLPGAGSGVTTELEVDTSSTGRPDEARTSSGGLGTGSGDDGLDGTTTTAGSTGEPEPRPSLEPLMWQVGCRHDLATCNSVDSCAVEEPDTAHELGRADQAMLQGDPSVIYEVELWLRGVVEPKGYEGGMTDGHWNEGGTPVADGWNTMRLMVSDPPRVLFLNAGPPAARFCLGIDETRTVLVRGGATVTIDMVDPNNCSIMNFDVPVADGGQPISIEGIDVPPQPHDGQFLDVRAVSISPMGG